MTRAELLAGALDEFLTVSPEVEAAAIVSSDGLPMASALPPGVEEDRLAAMSAALLILGERAANGLGKGDLCQVMVEAGDGYIVLMAAGPHAVLVGVTSTDAKAGLLLFEMKRMAGKVETLMRRAAVADTVEAPERTAEEDTAPADAAVTATAGEPDPSLHGW
jgi:uncharacterized protein